MLHLQVLESQPPVKNFHRVLLDNLYNAVYFVDRKRKILYWNEAAERLTGYAACEVLGGYCHNNLLQHVDAAGQALCQGSCPLSRTIADGMPRETEIYLRHREGHRVAVTTRVTPIRDEVGRIVGAVEIFTESQRRPAQPEWVDEERRQAFLDALTALPNRRALKMRMQTALIEQGIHGDPFGVMLIDVDHVKGINETWGQEAGDRVLLNTAKTLRQALRQDDIVGRWDGDEFLALLKHVDQGTLYRLAERCRALVAQTRIMTMQGELIPTVSLGAALAEADDTEDILLGRVGRLLEKGKAQGRNSVCVENEAPPRQKEVQRLGIPESNFVNVKALAAGV